MKDTVSELQKFNKQLDEQRAGFNNGFDELIKQKEEGKEIPEWLSKKLADHVKSMNLIAENIAESVESEAASIRFGKAMLTYITIIAAGYLFYYCTFVVDLKGIDNVLVPIAIGLVGARCLSWR